MCELQIAYISLTHDNCAAERHSMKRLSIHHINYITDVEHGV